MFNSFFNPNKDVYPYVITLDYDYPQTMSILENDYNNSIYLCF